MTAREVGESDPIARFAAAAERFCAWAETPPADVSREAHTACVLLLDLMRASVDLPESSGSDLAPSEVDEAEWRRVFARFESMCGPRLYAYVEPTAPDQGVGWSDLHEDLADLWRELRECLGLFHDGHEEAGAWHWRVRFELYSGFLMARLLQVLIPARRALG